jgi:hypothetical protein
MAADEEVSLAVRQRVIVAIRLVRSGIRWKPGKDASHLQTRIGYGHLPNTATLADYEQIINRIVHDPTALVYGYFWEQVVYPTVVGSHEGYRWLVMFGLNGVMETAFPPDDPAEYLADTRFRYLGVMQELMK